MTAGPHGSRYSWSVLSVTSLAVLLMGINAGSLIVALPLIVRDLGLGAVAANWVLLAYMLTNTVLILVFGRLADIFGRRKPFLAGLVLFTATSVLLGAANGGLALIVLRAIQGVGAALVITNVSPILIDAFPASSMSQALGLNMMVISAAQVIGPAVGGLIGDGFGWRWIFWFNVPLGTIAALWARHTLREPRVEREREPVDAVGALLVLAALTGLLLALSEGGAWGWTSRPVVVGIVLFAVLTPVFLYVQARHPYPLVDLSLFRRWEFSAAVVTAFVNSAVRFSVLLVASLLLQGAAGLSAAASSLHLLPLPLGLMVASPVAGVVGRRIAAQRLATAGLGITAGGLVVLLVTLGGGGAGPGFAVGMLVVGVGVGVFQTPNTTSILAGVSSERRGIANGIRSMSQNTGTLVGTALGLVVLTGQLPRALRDDAYSGTLARLSSDRRDALLLGGRYVLVVMLVAVVASMVLSSMRERGQPMQSAMPAAAD